MVLDMKKEYKKLKGKNLLKGLKLNQILIDETKYFKQSMNTLQTVINILTRK